MQRLRAMSIAGLAIGALGLAGCTTSSAAPTTPSRSTSAIASHGVANSATPNPTSSGATITGIQSPSAAGTFGTEPTITVPSGAPPTQLEEANLIVGSGPTAKAGDLLTVQYVGVAYSSKAVFDASWSRGQPYSFTLGQGTVIPGWELGIVGMRVGGRRELIIPPNLAYGAQSPGPGIAPNDTLIFIIDLVKIG